MELSELIAEDEALVRQLLGDRLGEEVGEGLELTGLEIVGFLAAQVVLPIVSNFVSDVLYERYRRIPTRAVAAQAREELRDAVPAEQPAVDPAAARRDVVVVLVGEGIAEDVAEEAARAAHDRVAASLAAGSATAPTASPGSPS